MKKKIEAVLHFAAFIEVGESVADPYKYYRNNFAGSLVLLHAMRETNVKKLVFSSTAAVYGSPTRVPISEDHPLQPINPYGRSKWMTELAIEDACQAYGLSYANLRYFNVAGASPDGSIGEAHDPETHLIPRVLHAAASGGSISIYGTDYETPDGTCIRDYVHVIDLARAHVLALQNLVHAGGSIFNLGSETGFSVRQVIEACRTITGKKFSVEEHPRRPGDPAILIASSARMLELGWRPQYQRLEQMIEHAWQWHSKNPRGYS